MKFVTKCALALHHTLLTVLLLSLVKQAAGLTDPHDEKHEDQ